MQSVAITVICLLEPVWGIVAKMNFNVPVPLWRHQENAANDAAPEEFASVMIDKFSHRQFLSEVAQVYIKLRQIFWHHTNTATMQKLAGQVAKKKYLSYK